MLHYLYLSLVIIATVKTGSVRISLTLRMRLYLLYFFFLRFIRKRSSQLTRFVFPLQTTYYNHMVGNKVACSRLWVVGDERKNGERQKL